eukprot:942230-Karenia_brevis.AAC.1
MFSYCCNKRRKREWSGVQWSGADLVVLIRKHLVSYCFNKKMKRESSGVEWNGVDWILST